LCALITRTSCGVDDDWEEEDDDNRDRAIPGTDLLNEDKDKDEDDCEEIVADEGVSSPLTQKEKSACSSSSSIRKMSAVNLAGSSTWPGGV
jgi:tRNA(Glu) U13 pseudouridine synthase TruD